MNANTKNLGAKKRKKTSHAIWSDEFTPSGEKWLDQPKNDDEPKRKDQDGKDKD